MVKPSTYVNYSDYTAAKAEDSDGKTDSYSRTVSLDAVTIAYLRRHLAMLDRDAREFGKGYQGPRQAVLSPGQASARTRAPPTGSPH